MAQLPVGFFYFLLDYSFICENLRQPEKFCQFDKALSVVSEILAFQSERAAFAGKSDADCQKYLFSRLRHNGVKDETLEVIDGEYSKLQDERRRIAGMNHDEFAAYTKNAMRAVRTLKQKTEVV